MSAVDDMTIHKWTTLVRLLNSLTDSKKIKWDRGARDDTYITSVGAQIVEITNESGTNNTAIRIEINDDFGDTVDQFSDEDLKPDMDFTPYSFMLNLYRKAARQASGADTILDDILSKLQADDDNPF